MNERISRVAEARAYVIGTLREGLAPGTSVSVKRTAEALRISPTPVREALERLVGEGVLVAVPARHGFATPRLTWREVAGLHALFGTLLNALVTPAGDRPDDRHWAPDPSDPAGAVRQALASACTRSDMSICVSALLSAELRLLAYRLVEPAVLGDGWATGLVELRSGLIVGGRAAERAVSRFVGARTSAAAAIVAELEERHRDLNANRFGI